MGTRWPPARTFFAIPLLPWFQLVFALRNRHYVVADGRVIHGSLISAILAGVPLTSRKLHRCRRQSLPPQLLIPYSGGSSRHVTDITFTRAAGHPPQHYISHSSTCFVAYRKSRPCRRQLRVPTSSGLQSR